MDAGTSGSDMNERGNESGRDRSRSVFASFPNLGRAAGAISRLYARGIERGRVEVFGPSSHAEGSGSGRTWIRREPRGRRLVRRVLAPLIQTLRGWGLDGWTQPLLRRSVGGRGVCEVEHGRVVLAVKTDTPSQARMVENTLEAISDRETPREECSGEEA